MPQFTGLARLWALHLLPGKKSGGRWVKERIRIRFDKQHQKFTILPRAQNPAPGVPCEASGQRGT